MGFSVRKRDVNRQLYYSGRYRNAGTSDSPAWQVSSTPSSESDSGPVLGSNIIPFPSPPPDIESIDTHTGHVASSPPAVATPTTDDGKRDRLPRAVKSTDVPVAELPGLTSWQAAARRRWYRAGCKGVVEAVTGSGKTYLGAAIITDELLERRKVLILVPTIVLAHQWYGKIRHLIPHATVGILGDGHTQVPIECDVIVAVKNSAATRAEQLTFVHTVIADECHNYAATVVRRALIPTADHRLGLTATFERLDDGIREVLRPYFGDTIYTCGFDKAFKDNLIAPARIALVGVSFTQQERSEYDEAHELMTKHRRTLIARFGVPAKPFGVFMMTVGGMAKDPSDPGHTSARVYLKARNRTRELLASAEAKTNFMLNMAPLLEESNGALLFCERISAADRACGHLSAVGLHAAAFHSKIPAPDRAQALQQLARQQLDVLCTAKALDEGVDVPDTDLGLVAAGTQQRRQMIQRLGRVLRAKPDGRAARFIITYVTGAHEEDPGEGAHESFLKEIDTIVGEHRTFTSTQISDVIAFLKQPSLHHDHPAKTKTQGAPVRSPDPRLSPSPERISHPHYGARLLRGFDCALKGVIALARREQVADDDLTLPGTLIANAALHQAIEAGQDAPRIAALPTCSEVVSNLSLEDAAAVNRICQALTNACVQRPIRDLWAYLFLEVFDSNFEPPS